MWTIPARESERSCRVHYGRNLRCAGDVACCITGGRHRLNTHHYPRKAHRRQQCATVLNISGTVQPSVARSATEGSASSAATPAKLPSVRRSALTASCVAKKMTVDGYVGFKLPDNGQSEDPPAFLRACCFALGGAT
jgi:hypothetical protein